MLNCEETYHDIEESCIIKKRFKDVFCENIFYIPGRTLTHAFCRGSLCPAVVHENIGCFLLIILNSKQYLLYLLKKYLIYIVSICKMNFHITLCAQYLHLVAYFVLKLTAILTCLFDNCIVIIYKRDIIFCFVF